MNRSLNKWLIASLITAGAMLFSTGFAEGEAVLVEDEYIVQRGDCLREISEKYLEKNTYGPRYILEFEEGIHELNPWIRQQGGVIYPGNVVRINYWIKAE